MAAEFVRSNDRRAGEASVQPRSLLRRKVAELSEAECAEVIEYIEIMHSLRREAVRLKGERSAPPGLVG